MSIRSLAAALAVLALSACPQQASTPSTSAERSLETEDDKAFYSLGFAMSRTLQGFMLTPEEFEAVALGLRDGVLGGEERVADRSQYLSRIRSLQAERAQKYAEQAAAEAEAYLAERAADEGAVVRESGIIYQELTSGAGEQPTATSQVTVDYHGTLADGSTFDSTRVRGQPATFGLDGVIPCWTEAIPLMRVGGKAKITCPAQTAYGDAGAGSIPPGAVLTFEVELLGIED